MDSGHVPAQNNLFTTAAFCGIKRTQTIGCDRVSKTGAGHIMMYISASAMLLHKHTQLLEILLMFKPASSAHPKPAKSWTAPART